MENQYPFDESQFILSYELLHLLQWLVQKNPAALKRVVGQALEKGLREDIELQKSTVQRHDPEILQRAVLDFFSLLENALHDVPAVSDELVVEPVVMSDTFDQLDSTLYEKDELSLCLARVKRVIKKGGPASAREALYKELLKNWRPKDKGLYN
jgi:hypothetical protein